MIGFILLALFIIGFFMSSKSEKFELLKEIIGVILIIIIGLILIGFTIYFFIK
jgi:hypothetical protein